MIAAAAASSPARRTLDRRPAPARASSACRVDRYSSHRITGTLQPFAVQRQSQRLCVFFHAPRLRAGAAVPVQRMADHHALRPLLADQTGRSGQNPQPSMPAGSSSAGSRSAQSRPRPPRRSGALPRPAPAASRQPVRYSSTMTWMRKGSHGTRSSHLKRLIQSGRTSTCGGPPSVNESASTCSASSGDRPATTERT